MRHASLFVTALLCITICMSSMPTTFAQADNKVTADVAFADGLESVSFDTLEGRVEVDLPDDVSDSDTISGTVIAEPKGVTREEFIKNEDELSGYVVEIAKTQEVKEAPPLAEAQKQDEEQSEKETSPIKDKPLQAGCIPPPTIKKTPPEIKLEHHKENSFTCQIPPACGKFTVILKDPTGHEVCRKDVKSAPAKPKHAINASHPPKCQIPPSGTCGKALIIPGTCDGRSATSRIKINNRPCRLLAESPRRQIARAPKYSVGKYKIESAECGFVRSGFITLKPALASTAKLAEPATASPQPEKKKDLSGKWLATCTDHGITVTTDGVAQSYPGQGQMPPALVQLSQQGNQLTWSYPQQARTSETQNLAVTEFTGTLNGNMAELYWKRTHGTSKYNYVMKLRYDPASDTIDADGNFHTTVWNGYSISRSTCKLRRAGADSLPTASLPPPRPKPKNGVWVLQSVTPRFRWSTLDYKNSQVHCQPRPRYYSNPAGVTIAFTEPPKRIRRGDVVSLRVTLMAHGQGFPVVGQGSWLVYGFMNGAYSSNPAGQGNQAAELPARPQNFGQFSVVNPPPNLDSWGSDASIQLGWVGNSSNEDITWKYKWVQDAGDDSTASAPSQSYSPPANRYEAPAQPEAKTAPPAVPQRSEDRKASYARNAQIKWLHDLRQLEFDRAIATMLGNSRADANARAEALRKNNQASSDTLTASMDSLENDLQSSGRKIGFINYDTITSSWNRTIDLSQVPQKLQQQLDVETQQKMQELSKLERRNPKLAVQLASQWRDGIVNWAQNQLDSLQTHWDDADRTIQRACANAAARRQLDYVSFHNQSGAIDLTNEVLSSLQSGR